MVPNELPENYLDDVPLDGLPNWALDIYENFANSVPAFKEEGALELAVNEFGDRFLNAVPVHGNQNYPDFPQAPDTTAFEVEEFYQNVELAEPVPSLYRG